MHQQHSRHQLSAADIDDGACQGGRRRPMRENVRQALAIDTSSTIEDRTIDITTTGRRSGEPRRIEIAFYRLGDDIYLSGIPGLKTRSWLANLAAQPQFTFHLKQSLQADLPARATPILDQARRRAIIAAIHQQRGVYHDVEAWVESSPLVAVELLVP